MAKLNITQAAKRAGIGRNTLYEHMKKGKVSYEVDDEGKKLVDTSELDRAYGKTEKNRTVGERSTERPIEHDRTAEIEQLLRGQISDLKSQVENLRQEKDKLLSIVDRQTLMLEDKREKQGETPPQQPIDKRIVYAIVGICGLSFSIPLVAWVVQEGFFAKLLN